MIDKSEWRLTSPGGVKHRLISQSGGFQEESASWTMVVCIHGEDLVTFVEEVFPLPVFTLIGFVYERRFYPAGLPALRAVDLKVEGFTEGRPIDPFNIDLHAPEDTYEKYLRCTIQFEPGPENDSPDPSDPSTFLDISCSSAGQFLSADVDSDRITWEDDAGDTEGHQDDDPPTKQRVIAHEIQWTAKWSQIPYAWMVSNLMPRLRLLEGHVNSVIFASFYNAPIETVLFESWSMNNQFTWRSGHAGSSPVTVSLKFTEKNFIGLQDADWIQITQQHIWRPGKGWYKIKVNDKYTYPTANLNSLFIP